MISYACAGCHGTNGGSAGLAMPSLASQSKTAIVDAMKKFKSGERPSTVMGRLAKGYADADFEAMGNFFSRQRFHPTGQAVDKAKAAKGSDLQEANCSRCHLDDGKDGKDDTPVMASQWLPYLQMQMELYQSGKRKMPEKMAEKVKPLSKEDLDALLHFYASVNK
jgi:sulfide dehydrogenase cytochrome subunit